MKVYIKRLAIGWKWTLDTEDGFRYEGVALDWKTMWSRIWHYDGLVIDHEA